MINPKSVTTMNRTQCITFLNQFGLEEDDEYLMMKVWLKAIANHQTPFVGLQLALKSLSYTDNTTKYTNSIACKIYKAIGEMKEDVNEDDADDPLPSELSLADYEETINMALDFCLLGGGERGLHIYEVNNVAIERPLEEFHNTKSDCQAFLGQFNNIEKDVKEAIVEIWFVNMKRGEDPVEALKVTLLSSINLHYVEVVLANEILEAFGKLINKNIELFKEKPKEPAKKQVVAPAVSEVIKAVVSEVSPDYVNMDYNEWDKINKSQGKGVVIESPDVDFSETVKKVPSEVRNQSYQCKYTTFELCEKAIDDNNRDYFNMFKWKYSPKHNAEYDRIRNEATERMASTKTPEELIKEAIEYRKTHQYILTVPRINTKATFTRVVKTDKLDSATIRKMTIHRGSKIFYEGINEVMCPQQIAVHPYVDFDFDFEDMTTEEEKQDFVEGVFKWLDSLKPVFGKYCAGGYTKLQWFADKYFSCGYSLYKGEGHQVSLHVIFYEKAILVNDLIELFRGTQYTKGIHEKIDRNVYQIDKRRLLRHILSPKLNINKDTHKPENRLYNGTYLMDHEPENLCDTFVALSGNETPVSDDLLYEFFGFRHENHIPKQGSKPPVKTPVKTPVKNHVIGTIDASFVDIDDKQCGFYEEKRVKVILPKEYMQKLFELVPWRRYGDFMFHANDLLHKAVTAFIANSPYSYDDTIELLNGWWLREPHHNHDNEMSEMVAKEYYRDGIHDQKNNSYYTLFYSYVCSQIPKREFFEEEACKEYNVPKEVYREYRQELDKKYATCQKNRNLSRSYYPYIKELEQEASKIDKLPKAPGAISNSKEDDFADLYESTTINQYDWLPEIMKMLHPENDEKIKLKEAVKFKFHTTMFKLDEIIKEKTVTTKGQWDMLDKIEFEFGKRIMAMNIAPSEGGIFYYRYNNYKDEETKGLMTINYNPLKGFVNKTTKDALQYFYENHPFDPTKIWITSLRELQKLSREQRLLSIYSVSDDDPRLEDAKRFIEIIRKTFRRPIDARAYFEFLRKKLENPNTKLDYNICCYGASGVFKTALTNILGLFLSTKILSMTDVQNKFNQWIIDTSLSIVEEIGQQEENAADKAEALKRILNWNVNVEVKNGPHVDVDSCMNMIMNCNFDSIGGLMDFRPTDDMNRRFIFMPRIRPANWKVDLNWGSSYINDKNNWRFVCAVVLREPYLTDDERKCLMTCQEEEEHPRFKTVVGKRGVLLYDDVKECVTRTDRSNVNITKRRLNSYCLNIDALGKKLKHNDNYNAGGLTEKALLVTQEVLENNPHGYNYVIDIVKLYFIYVMRPSETAAMMLLEQLKMDYPGCEESETYKSEMRKLEKAGYISSFSDIIQPNPEMDDE